MEVNGQLHDLITLPPIVYTCMFELIHCISNMDNISGNFYADPMKTEDVITMG
jgi:hypothetical protein